MSRNRALVIAVVVVAFVAVGGYLAYRGTGGGGAAVSIDLKVTGSTMTPGNPTAKAGDMVTMTITTDRDEEIHLHGYDIPFECKAGEPTSHTFTADKTGTFPIEWESTSTPLGDLVVSP